MDRVDTDAQDQADMARLAAGHDAALNDLMERHAGALFRFLCRMVGQENDANDLAQETFARVFRHRANFQPQARFTTWLFTIAANLARNELRRRHRHLAIALDEPLPQSDFAVADTLAAADPPPDQQALDTERLAAVRHAVSRLPDDMREAVVLCELEDLHVAEAATILASTPKAVESRLYRARQLLRKRLDRWF
ncbi:MAG TPA: RNA polymerase sigma factor [Verrucomicrobiae bacterium]|jgi:RNA polymerase sigma-70 factor (ECF subfamily)